MVGFENRGNPIRYYLAELLAFRGKCITEGLDIPFLFHAGETLKSGDSTDENLMDAILLGSKRIGHGYTLAKHPALMEICRERGIAIEVCPISNEILHLCPSIEGHILPVLLNNGVPCTLNSDNASYFMYVPEFPPRRRIDSPSRLTYSPFLSQVVAVARVLSGHVRLRLHEPTWLAGSRAVEHRTQLS